MTRPFEEHFVDLLHEVDAPPAVDSWRRIDRANHTGQRRIAWMPRALAPALVGLTLAMSTVGIGGLLVVYHKGGAPVATSGATAAPSVLHPATSPTNRPIGTVSATPSPTTSTQQSAAASPTASGLAPTAAPGSASPAPPAPAPTTPTTPTAPAAPGPGTFAFSASADAFVDSDNAGSNYGSAASLVAGSNPLRHTYLRFSVSGLAGNVSSVTLRLHVTGPGGGFSDHAVTDSSWTESGITYQSAPSYGPTIATDTNITATGWWTIDATPIVSGDGTYTICLTSATAVTFDSREAGAAVAPQLVIVTQ